jgi:hypothetical protein
MQIPKIEGVITDDIVGSLFLDWWDKQGEPLFVAFCRKGGMILMDGEDFAQSEDTHNKLFENVE